MHTRNTRQNTISGSCDELKNVKSTQSVYCDEDADLIRWEIWKVTRELDNEEKAIMKRQLAKDNLSLRRVNENDTETLAKTLIAINKNMPMIQQYRTTKMKRDCNIMIVVCTIFEILLMIGGVYLGWLWLQLII